MKNIIYKSMWVILPPILLSLISCATTPKQQAYSSEKLRVNLGTIGIVSGNFQPEVRFQKPMSKGAAALYGAGMGATDQPHFMLIPVGVLAGGIVGAVEGAPSKKIRDAEDVLNGYLSSINLQETLRERLLSVARGRTHYPLVLIEGQDPKALDEEVTYGSLPDEDIDTLLEMSLRKCNLQGIKGRINPPLRLLMAAGIRLIRVKDGKVLHSHNFIYGYEYDSDLLKFSEWAANNAQPFKEELNRAFSYLALQIVRELINIQADSSNVMKN